MTDTSNAIEAQYTEIPTRSIETITGEIRTIRASVQTLALQAAVEIGRRLTEAKELLPHGEWGGWLKNEFEYSQSTATRLMSLFREYGAEQGSLFEAEVKSSALHNLSITNALRLIAIPEEEREDFAAANNVDELSTRELDRLIKEKQEAERASAEAHELLEKKTDELAAAKKLKSAAEDAEKNAKAELEKSRKAMQTELTQREAAAKSAEAKLAEALKDAKEAREELERLKAEPEIPPEKLDALKAEYAKAAADAEARAAEAEKRLSMASPEVAVFKVYFEAVQKDFRALADCLGGIKDGETAGKLKAAVKAVLARLEGELG